MDKEQYIQKDRSETRYYSDEKMTVLHRSDGPAILHESGYKCWYHYGELHREDGPAIEGAHGYNYWFQYGKRHRLDGPAIEWTNGDKEWYVNGKLHRSDGPAVECTNGDRFWYRNGIMIGALAGTGEFNALGIPQTAPSTAIQVVKGTPV